MNTQPLVSVIIPFFNAGIWLAEAIESVINQTHNNVEIILVDDGSTKEDADIALNYANKFPHNIFYVQHDEHINKGLPASRNAGIVKAKGELVAFLDADDKWMPQKLNNQINIFKEFPQVQMICEASCFWYTWQDANRKDGIIYIGASQGIYQPPELMKQLYPFGEGQPPCPSSIIIKKDALQRSGGFEKKFSGVYQLYEDQAFLSKIYARETVYISNEANNYYRKRNNSMSSAANNEELYHKVRLFYYQWLKNYFSAPEFSDSEIIQLVENFKQKLLKENYTSGITL